MSGILAGLDFQHLSNDDPSPMKVTSPSFYSTRSVVESPDGSSVKPSDHARRHIDQDILRLEESIRTLRSRRNALAPISLLPPEILAKVFIFVAAGFINDRNPVAWVKVTHVSRHWRAVAITCPSLWDTIVFNRPRWAEEMLRRSKMASLVINVDLSLVTPKMVEAVQMALHDVFRIRELTIKASGPTMQKVFSDLADTAPLLHTLSLSSVRHGNYGSEYGSDYGFILPEGFLAGQTPRLKRLELKQCDISWKSPLLSNLSHLLIHHVSTIARPNINQFLDILDSMPRLETLDLVDSLPNAEGNVSVTPYDRNSDLPCLSSISLSASVPDCANLIRYISFPSTTAVKLRVRGTEKTEQDLNSLVGFLENLREHGSIATNNSIVSSLTNGASNAAAAANIRTLYLDVSSGDIIIKTWRSSSQVNANYSLYSSFNNASMEIVFASRHYGLLNVHDATVRLCEALPLAQLRMLSVSSLHIDAEAWASTFGQLRKLRSIDIRGNTSNGLLTALVMDRPVEDKMDEGGDVLSPTTPTTTTMTLRPRHRKRPSSPRPLRPVYFPALHTLIFREIDFYSECRSRYGKEGLIVTEFEYLQDCVMERYELGAEIRELELEDCSHITFDDVELLREVVVDVEWDECEAGFTSEEEETDMSDYDEEYDGEEYYDPFFLGGLGHGGSLYDSDPEYY